ncbi:hypothetical protein CYMTET_4566 [Cymbomonas tetramitiformis]|uniref:Reverse transcriptase domain-containing protein n=1 Tax=Cymbomonas tetramitiformis TaxID=36881 RepID=A0AAE0LJY1_9CHLO|nr:hypothetical protein CYMTET_4566 [Cymbomonas tetramitiformis]
MQECSRACDALLAEAGALRQHLSELKEEHSFGKHPMRELEAHRFEPLVFVIPELGEEECELDELPAGREASQEHWRARVHLLQGSVSQYQTFVKGRRPAVVISDVLAPGFFKKRKRTLFEESEGEPAAGPAKEGQPLTAEKRAELARMGAAWRTVDEETLAKAIRGELDPEEIAKPPGAGPAVADKGPLQGINLLVSPPQRLQPLETGRISWGEDGNFTVEAKAPKFKTMVEWSRGFMRIVKEAPADQMESLMDFAEWARSIAQEYGFSHFLEFYEHLVRRVQRSGSGITINEYDSVWRVYVRQYDVRPTWQSKGQGGGPRNKRQWPGQQHPPQQQQQPQHPGQGQQGARGNGKGGKGGGKGKGGKGGSGESAGERGMESEPPADDGEEQRGAEAQGECGCAGGRQPEGEQAAEAPDRWWSGLREDKFVPVWDVQGAPLRQLRGAVGAAHWGAAPLPVTSVNPGPWTVPGPVPRLRHSEKWPALRREIVERATIEHMEGKGTLEVERASYAEEVRRVGCVVPRLTERAHLLATAFAGWHDVDFLVRCAACGAGWPSEKMEMEEHYRVPNYVGPEHMEVKKEEIGKERAAGRIFPADWRLPLGVIALGMVERVRKGKVKYRPVSDYSRPRDCGVNARIELGTDEFSTVKEAYALLRPGHWMVKVDLESAYRSLGVASQYWAHQCFEFDDVRWMDTRAPFGYLDDFFMVAPTKELAEEYMMLLVEFVSFLGFTVNSEKCEGPAQVMEFLGVLLRTDGEVCTASIDEDRIKQVLQQAEELRAKAVRGTVRRKSLESLLGLLAFCSQVVWGLSLYTRRGFAFLAATVDKRQVRLPWAMQEDLQVMEAVVRRYNGRQVVLYRRERPWFPRREGVDESWSINYLELFAVWWALALWGHRMQGKTVVVRIDNMSAMHQVGSWWGPVEYIPLLRQIFGICAQHDVRLQPRYINTKDNLLADLLSRLQLDRFHEEHRTFMRATIWRQDRDDWMLGPVQWADIDNEFGPFTVDACVAPSRANSYCYVSWSREEDARVQWFDGHNAWGNLAASATALLAH